MKYIILIISMFYACNAFAQDIATPVAVAKELPQVLENADDKKEIQEEKPLWVYGSLMFDKKTSGWISEAIKSHDQQIPLEILLPSLFPSSPQPGNAIE